ncbi:MAG: hypothetical protein ACOC85_01065 [Thermoplasmatota archaeon]
MIDEKKLLYLAAIIALIGTSSLYLYAATMEARDIDISEISNEDVDSLITTEGFVSEVVSYGDSLSVTIKEYGDNSSIKIFLEGNIVSRIEKREEILPGAKIGVKGRVELYQEDLNIRIVSPDDFTIIEETFSSFTQIDYLLDNPEWYEGMNVKVRGEIATLESRNNGTYMEIVPLEGDYRVLGAYIEGWYHNEYKHIIEKTPVVLNGRFNYNKFNGQWIITCEENPEYR